MVAFAYRMDVGYSGATNRNHDSTVVREVMTATPAALPTSYGVMLVMDAPTGTVRAATAGDTVASFAGLFVRPYPTQGGGLLNPINDPLGTSTPAGPASEANVMKRGFMTVKLNAASPAVVKGQPMGVFIGAATAGNPAGGITGAAPGATVLAANGYFQGPADANGITEVAFNL